MVSLASGERPGLHLGRRQTRRRQRLRPRRLVGVRGAPTSSRRPSSQRPTRPGRGGPLTSTWRYDIGVKKDHYERAGLSELWLVDTESELLLVYRRSTPSAPEFDVALELGAGEELTSPPLPGFTLAVEELFAR